MLDNNWLLVVESVKKERAWQNLNNEMVLMGTKASINCKWSWYNNFQTDITGLLITIVCKRCLFWGHDWEKLSWTSKNITNVTFGKNIKIFRTSWLSLTIIDLQVLENSHASHNSSTYSNIKKWTQNNLHTCISGLSVLYNTCIYLPDISCYSNLLNDNSQKWYYSITHIKTWHISTYIFCSWFSKMLVQKVCDRVNATHILVS